MKTEKDRRKTEKDRTFHSILFRYYIWYLDIIFNLYIVFIVKTEEDRKKTEEDRINKKGECNAYFISKFNKDGRRYGWPC